ncbi:MAG: response regulator [Proteobacteria bacterium]|nr:response regulator [Pseudomonadota bacterium]
MEKYKVLVVDDEPLIRSLLDKYFKTDDRFEVDLKEDGSFIMKGALTSKYDLIVFDVLMPNVNGIELLQNIIAKNPGIKTLAITGMANEGLLRQIMTLGCLGVLKKHIKKKEFMDAVYKAMKLQPKE